MNNKGKVLVLLKKFDEAMSCFDEALKIDSNFVFSLQNKAECLRKMGKYEEGIKICQVILRQDPTNLLVLKEAGIMMIYSGNAERAAMLFNEVLGSVPSNAELLFLKGVAHEKMNQQSVAEEYFNKAKAIDSTIEELRNELPLQ